MLCYRSRLTVSPCCIIFVIITYFCVMFIVYTFTYSIPWFFLNVSLQWFIYFARYVALIFVQLLCNNLGTSQKWNIIRQVIVYLNSKYNVYRLSMVLGSRQMPIGPVTDVYRLSVATHVDTRYNWYSTGTYNLPNEITRTLECSTVIIYPGRGIMNERDRTGSSI